MIKDQFKDRWTIQYLKDLVRVAPIMVIREIIKERNKRTAKLIRFPFETTAYDLKELLNKVNAKIYFILRMKTDIQEQDMLLFHLKKMKILTGFST